MSAPSSVSVRLALVSTWCAVGAIVTSGAFVSETVELEVTRALGLASPSLALLTFWLMTVVVQGAMWWVTVAVKQRVDTPPEFTVTEALDGARPRSAISHD